MIEMTGNFSVARLIVQAENGDDPELQANAHAFEALRGVISGIIIFAAAGPIAGVFGILEVTWAYQVIALAPAIRGFRHLDCARTQRTMNFKQLIWTDTGSKVVSTVIAIPLALIFDDFRVMLWVIIAQSIFFSGISHLVATRKYRWSWNRVLMKEIIRFGWPLLASGYLLFLIMQGDRLIIGITFSMEELGWFGAAAALTLALSGLLMNLCQTLFLPELSRAQKELEKFNNLYIFTVEGCLLLGLILAIGFAVAGPSLIILLYGERYAAGITIIGLLGISQGFRIATAGPTIVALSRGATLNPLFANIARCFGVLLALGALWMGAGIVGIVISGIIGEALSFTTSTILLRRTLKLDISAIIFPSVAAASLALITLIATSFLDLGQRPFIELPVAAAVTLLLCAICIAAMPVQRRILVQTVRKLLSPSS